MKNLNKVKCNTIYILDNTIYPLLTKGENHLNKEYDTDSIEAYGSLKLLRAFNIIFNTCLIAFGFFALYCFIITNGMM